MTPPFQQIAAQYAALWSDTPRGKEQRKRVWQEVDALFHPGDRILDLGCGTGDDAVHLTSNDVQVWALDSAPGMVEIARARGVDARQMAIEQLASVGGEFDGAISNFGALNCVADLGAVSKTLSRLIRPRGKLALCVMSRYCWSDVRHLLQRWSGHTVWRGMDVYYRSSRSIACTFSTHFEFERRVSIGRGDHQLLILSRRLQC